MAVSNIDNFSVNLNASDFFNLSRAELPCDSLFVELCIMTAFSFASFFFLYPLFVFVFLLACQRWRQSDSCPEASSHLDVFAYHMLAMELLEVLGCLSFCIGAVMIHPMVLFYSMDVISILSGVKVDFLMLTCVDLYLAVVHPLSYLQHRSSAGVVIRNCSIACVWLLCFARAVLTFLEQYHALFVMYFANISVIIFVVSFCCGYVLWTLRRPTPGEMAEDGNQSKRRAFRAMVLILSMLLLNFCGGLVFNSLRGSLVLSGKDECLTTAGAILFTLPGSLVLPFLYLKRAGKLSCARSTTR